MQDLRTPEQKAMMAALGPLLTSGIQRGATPFGGQLSYLPDMSMLDAMNVQHMVGTGQPYRWGGMQTGPYPFPGQANPGNYSGGGGGDRSGPPGDWPGPHDPYGGYDPYAPWRPDHPPSPAPRPLPKP